MCGSQDMSESHNHRRRAGLLGCCHQITVAASCSLLSTSLDNDALELKGKSCVCVKLAMLHKSFTRGQLAVPVVGRAGAMAHCVVLVAVTRVKDVEETGERTLNFKLVSQ